MTAELSRRAVVGGAAGLALLPGCDGQAMGSAASFPGTLGGANATRGHRLRKGDFPAVAGPERQLPLVIAGGGVAGLAAAWRLKEAGYHDFELLELEDSTGGNARSGRNAISAYPLGAHYLPVPNQEARALRHMLAQFGMITGEQDGAPVYDSFQLCADLEERLFWRGQWQEGLVPASGLSAADKADLAAFDAAMAGFRTAIGNDGRPAFASPMALSSSDPRFTALDGQSFADWLEVQGWRSPVLRAHVRYCCRDDYGTEPEDLSAWAGVHYFAGRRGWAANDDGDRELTWPEGNGRLVRLMAARCRPAIRTGQSVFRAVRDGDTAVLDVHDTANGQSRRIRAQAAILAMPLFVAARVAPGTSIEGLSYAPWVVAAVSVNRHPGGPGAPLAWDNVSTASPSLGYVVATHQSQSAAEGPTVLSWYMALSDLPPKDARKLLLTRTLAEWQRIIRDDILRLNPDLDGAITRIDVWRWGHAMARPEPGFLTLPARLAAVEAAPPLLHAHADLSGLSLFEEAHHRGVLAAEAAMRHLGHPFESLA
jgi:hypothetical protein